VTDERRGRSPLGRQEGFTIVEVLLAMVLLVIGILGMLVMVQGSVTSTSRTTAREGATNLVREIVERSREVPYAMTTTGSAPAALAATLPESPPVTGSSFVVRRRNFDYTITITACSIDDPSDGAGVGDPNAAGAGTFCNAPTSSIGPGGAGSGSGLTVGPSVLGLPVTLAVGGSLVNTVCNAVGTNTPILNSVSSLGTSLVGLAGNGAQLSVCPAAGGGSVAFDTRPDDLRRVRVRADWSAGNAPATSLTQTTLLTTPA
jgi:type II secretory pathway pseudopilin PulG